MGIEMAKAIEMISHFSKSNSLELYLHLIQSLPVEPKKLGEYDV